MLRRVLGRTKQMIHGLTQGQNTVLPVRLDSTTPLSQKASKHDQEIPQSQTLDQPMVGK